MKHLIVVAVLALLMGCASAQKNDQQILSEAASQYASTLPAGQTSMSLPSVKIKSHGLIADGLAMAAGGGANAAQLKQMLLASKAAGETGFLIIGSSSTLDVVVIENACAAQDLSGMQIFYSGDVEQKAPVQAAIEKTKARFHYLSPD